MQTPVPLPCVISRAKTCWLTTAAVVRRAPITDYNRQTSVANCVKTPSGRYDREPVSPNFTNSWLPAHPCPTMREIGLGQNLSLLGTAQKPNVTVLLNMHLREVRSKKSTFLASMPFGGPR